MEQCKMGNKTFWRGITVNEFDGMESVDMCDGCGNIEKIVFVSEFGQAFCQGCMDRTKKIRIDEQV
jgi:hypothetical protein